MGTTQPTADERTPLLRSYSSGAALGNGSGSGSLGRRAHAPVQDGVSASGSGSTSEDIDTRFKRWLQRVGGRSDRADEEREPRVLVSVFESEGQEDSRLHFSTNGTAVKLDDIAEDLKDVHSAIKEGLYPKMIATGSSGSYFVRVRDRLSDKTRIVAVFKPSNEEPYGTLNPKRVFLRKYFWWAMGRPCLVPNFSAFSEVGASYLDERLDLHMVPRTRLVSLSSPTFHYEYKDRLRWERGQRELPQKSGSFQRFLEGYVNASEFLRAHPWPSRPRSMLESDLAAEQRARKGSTKVRKSKVRGCWSGVKSVLLCRQGLETADADRLLEDSADVSAEAQHEAHGEESWVWTPDRMRDFRLELERLVVLDYLMRNTDRSLDNFMVKRRDPARDTDDHPRAHRTVVVAAIDNSLSFPHTHPNGIREYPYGWLWCPVDLIGGPFSEETRAHFLPRLSSPEWWVGTMKTLRDVFEQDEHFEERTFGRQMEILRGQGWNIVQCLKNAGEGPLELCTRQKRLIKQDVEHLTSSETNALAGTKVKLDSAAAAVPVLKRASTTHADKTVSLPVDVSPAKESLLAEGAHPRSLPETTEWKGMASIASMLDSTAPAHPRHPSDSSSLATTTAAAELEAYSPTPASTNDARRASLGLGIEVLDNIDRAARRARRPAFAKRLSSMTARRPSVSERRTASQGDGVEAEDGANAGTSQGAATSSAAAMLASVASLPEIVKSDDSRVDVERGRSTVPVVSVGEATERVNGGAGASPSGREAPPAASASSLGRPRRARGWSIASLSSLGGGAAAARGSGGSADALALARDDRKVPVLVERLEVDSSRAWLSWY